MHEKEKLRTGGAEVRHDVEELLRRRISQRRTEDLLKRRALSVWKAARHHPYVATIAVGAGAVAAGAMLGVAELALGVLAGFSALKVFKGEESFEKAVEDAVEHQRG